MKRTLSLLSLLLLLAGGAQALEPAEMLPDPALEARARVLSRELRCVVCQNESIDSSEADIARDLRQIVRQRLAAGDSDTQVLAHMTERYGDFILMQPPVRPSTWALWFGPPALLLGAIVALWFGRRRRAAATDTAPLSADEERRLQELLRR